MDKKPVVMGTFDDLASGNQVTAQGCTTCPPLLGGVSIDPGSFSGIVGESDGFDVLAGFDNGGVKIVTSLAQTSTGNSSVASASSGQLNYNGVGSTTLQAQYSDCVAVTYTEPGTFGEEPGCECSAWDYFGDIAPVDVSPNPAMTVLSDGSLEGAVTDWALLPDGNFELTMTGPGYGVITGWGFSPGVIIDTVPCPIGFPICAYVNGAKVLIKIAVAAVTVLELWDIWQQREQSPYGWPGDDGTVPPGEEWVWKPEDSTPG